MSTNNIQIKLNKFNCSKCNKQLSSRQSKWRHENTCLVTNTLETRITQLEKLLVPSIDSCNKHLDMLINGIISTYSIIKNNYFNKTIISNEFNFNFIINNSIDIYISISNELTSKNSTVKYNLKYLNKLRPLPIKNKNYEKYIGKLISTLSDKLNTDTQSDYESDCSVYSDISDF